MADIGQAAVEVKNPLVLIERMIESKTAPEVMEKMMDLAERWDRNQAAKVFAESLTGFQAECPQIRKTKSAVPSGNFKGFDYAALDDVMRAITPLLRKWQIVVTFTTAMRESLMDCVCRIRVGTHTEETTVSIPIPTGAATNVQLYGQAVSYAKRYSLCAALNIITTGEDNDGAGAVDMAQAADIADLNMLIDQCERLGRPIDFDKFLKWLRVESLELLPLAGVEAAKRFLNNRISEARKGTRS